MGGRTFEEGYFEGWLSVAGEEPLPAERTEPPPSEQRDYKTGFFYGRGDALEKFIPGSGTKPPKRINNGNHAPN